MDDDQVERLAQAIHGHYLREQVKDGVVLGSRPAMVAWADLDEDKREANRAQARDIPAKLAAIGLRLGAASTSSPSLISPEQVESLARREHERWCMERRQSGWTLADNRDDTAKHTPLLVPWERLSEAERDKDRDAVRNIPAVLSEVGLAPVPA